MELRFYLDPSTGQPHIWNHNVTESEVEEALAEAGEDRPGRDRSRVAIGQTAGGRYLKVIYVPDTRSDGIFIITAYDLQGKALSAYRRRQTKRWQ